MLGQSPLLVGAVGGDFAEYRAWLVAHGVDCSGVRVFPDVHTARFVCTTDDDMRQIGSFYTGAMAHSREITMAPLRDRVDMVLIGATDPAWMVAVTKECRDLGIPFVADVSQQVTRMEGPEIRELVTGARYLMTNDYEFELLLRKTGWTETEVGDRVDVRVTTLGEHGVQIVGRDCGLIKVDVVPETGKVDPTGVGDAFRAGFLAGTSSGLSLDGRRSWGASSRCRCWRPKAARIGSGTAARGLDRLRDAYGPKRRRRSLRRCPRKPPRIAARPASEPAPASEQGAPAATGWEEGPPAATGRGGGGASRRGVERSAEPAQRVEDPALQPMVFSADETTDIGYELGTTVTAAYSTRGSRFTGKIGWVQLDLGADDHDHFIDPGERLGSPSPGSRSSAAPASAGASVVHPLRVSHRLRCPARVSLIVKQSESRGQHMNAQVSEPSSNAEPDGDTGLEALQESGPIDYLVVEFPGRQDDRQGFPCWWIWSTAASSASSTCCSSRKDTDGVVEGPRDRRPGRRRRSSTSRCSRAPPPACSARTTSRRRRRPRAGQLGRHPRLRERLGGAVRRRRSAAAAPSSWPAAGSRSRPTCRRLDEAEAAVLRRIRAASA